MKFKIQKIVLASIITSLPLLSFAEDACKQVQHEIKRTEMIAKSASENVVSYQATTQEMNSYSQGSVMKTISFTIGTTFIFSSKETKALVKNFFGKRLSVDQNFRLSNDKIETLKMNPNLSIEQNLANIKASYNAQNNFIDTLAMSQSKIHSQSVQNEIDELIKQSNIAAEGNIRKFGEVAKSIADQEVYLARLKALQDLDKNYLISLKELNKNKCNN